MVDKTSTHTLKRGDGLQELPFSPAEFATGMTIFCVVGACIAPSVSFGGVLCAALNMLVLGQSLLTNNIPTIEHQALSTTLMLSTLVSFNTRLALHGAGQRSST